MSANEKMWKKVTVILEIMIRKCGSASVELITPEKYKGFFKTVFQNRHHKSISREGGGTADIESILADSSSKRMDKRKHKELGFVSVENGSVHHRKRKRKSEENDNSPTSREPGVLSSNGGGREGTKITRDTEYAKSKKGQSADNRKEEIHQRA